MPRRESPLVVQVELRVDRRRVRQCPGCRHTWPVDWEYCPQCAVWLPGTERMESSTRVVPVRGIAQGGLMPTALALACEVRCDDAAPTAAALQSAHRLLSSATRAVAAFGGRAYLDPSAGLIGAWDAPASNADAAVSAAEVILAELPPSAQPRPLAGTRIGIGIAAMEGGNAQSIELEALAFRLATLASHDTVLVSYGVYLQTREWFDYQGVSPPVPRADPLPGPVFQLLGPKPERSGSRQAGPERAALVGRAAMLRALDRCLSTVAGKRRAVVLHVIGEAGIGKSRLLREWRAASGRRGRLAGWLTLETSGVPYGRRPWQAWRHLVTSLGLGAGAGDPDPTGRGLKLRRQLDRDGRPALILVDDVHWLDGASRSAVAAFIREVSGLRALVILAYRPSFARSRESAGLAGPSGVHRHLRLRGLSHLALSQLVGSLAESARVELLDAVRQTITHHARGNPLYAEEAIAHLGDTGGRDGIVTRSFPTSLPELLIHRIRWTLDHALPELEREYRASLVIEGMAFLAGPARRMLLDRLDSLEERLAAWLDRVDVIEEEAAQLRQFVEGLRAIDGQLALLSLFLGRQRPHAARLSQALARLRGGP